MAQPQITYVYGLLAPDTPELVAEHINERNKLWNTLVNRHLSTVDAFQSELKNTFPSIASEQAALATARMELAFAIKERSAEVPELKKGIKVQYDALRSLIDATPAIAAMSDRHSKDLFEQANFDIKGSFLWWPNHETLMQEFIRGRAKSISSAIRMNYRALSGDGSLYVTFKRPVPAVQLFGKCPTVGIMGQGRHRQLKITITTEGRKREDKQFATFPMIYHRPLPDGALVKQVRLMSWRIGTHRKYEVQFVMAGAAQRPMPAIARLAAGMDLGWRVTESGMRVASLMDSAGQVQHLELPPEWMLRSDYIDDIDVQLFAGLTPRLAEFREAAQRDDFAWIAAMLAKDKPHAPSLALKILQETTRPVPAALAQWGASLRGLVEEQAHLREKLQSQRLDIYRNFVADCCRRFHTLAMEKLNLKSLQQVHAGDAWIDHQRRIHRSRAALSILIRLFKEAERAGRINLSEHDTPYTTCTCHGCGHINKIESKLMVTCAKCGTVWDQDENSAANFLRKITPRRAA
jgi:hypothetical protein